MDAKLLIMIPLVVLGALSLSMLCWYIARQKGRNGRKWAVICNLALWLVPACGGLIVLIIAALMPKVGDPITGKNDKLILYTAIGFFIAGIAGFAMLVPAIMTIISAVNWN